MTRIAINGLGRIGRNFLRTLFVEDVAPLELVGINIGPANPEHLAHMIKYDTLMGHWPGTVSYKDGVITLNDKKIPVFTECDPDRLPWGDLNVDWVAECSGRFTKREGAELHRKAGARNVLISAPAKGEDVTIIPGVNDDAYQPEKHHIVSLGSCTTNAFLPMIKALHDGCGIAAGYMTTVHAYTNTQVLIDVDDSDLRRSRAAALNIIPTTTGAAKLVGKIMPELEGRVSACAMRVPLGKVSIVDFAFTPEKSISAQGLNEIFEKASHGAMKGILAVSNEPCVSSDYSGSNYSVVIDGLMTDMAGSMGKVLGWYDNEWAYSVRLRDFLRSCS